MQSIGNRDKMFDDGHLLSVPNSTNFVKEWARRHPNKNKVGGSQSREYIVNLKDDIERFFVKGKRDSGDKMNAT